MASKWEGQTLGGRYQIQQMLGQGGMSAVYRAYDPNLQRTVAIKLIHPHLSDNPEFVRRFESEATAIARLRHPNIVQVFDFNHQDDVYYMVLEFVAGETLQQRIARLGQAGRLLEIKDALRYTVDVCKAADYAHQRGTVHRDIKPANVMLDVNGNAILMDFGIARMLGGQQHTATGAVLGTALYMSPEQIQGLHPDARADIYSIGVTLFEALGGRPPFEADSVMTLMMMHLNDPVPDLNALHPGIPESVKAVVNRSLEKDRNQRYQTAADMAAALQAALDERTAAHPAPQPARQPAPTPPPPPQPVESTMVEPVTPEPARPSARPKPTPPPGPAQRPPVPLEATFVEPAAPAAEAARAHPAEPPARPPAPPPPPPATPSGKAGSRRLIPILAAVLVVAAVAVGAILLLGNPSVKIDLGGGSTPVAALAGTATFTPAVPPASPTPQPTETSLPPTATATETLIPATDTPTPEPTATLGPVVLGGADVIAYTVNNEIWLANVDGSGAWQITQDGATKKYLRWLPDGSGLTFISGKCINVVTLGGGVRSVTCFKNSEYLDGFEPSPDYSRVAITLDHQLYLMPYDLALFEGIDSHPDLAGWAECKELAPYTRNAIRYARWSKDGKLLATVTMGVLGDGRGGDIVQIFAVDKCIANPGIQLQFPGPHFTFGEYNRQPSIPHLGWDGESLFVLHGVSKNGFGNLVFFNRQNYKAELEANPIGGGCCYHDAEFSPDGNYLAFAYQDFTAGGPIQLYYVPYTSLGTGVAFSPLPIDDISGEPPEIALRPAK